MRDAILIGDNPERCATPININGVGTTGGPPILDKFNILLNAPIIESTLLKSVAIFILLLLLMQL